MRLFAYDITQNKIKVYTCRNQYKLLSNNLRIKRKFHVKQDRSSQYTHVHSEIHKTTFYYCSFMFSCVFLQMLSDSTSLQESCDGSDGETQMSVSPKDSEASAHLNYVEHEPTSGHVEFRPIASHVELEPTSGYVEHQRNADVEFKGSFRESRNSRPSVIYRFGESFLGAFPNFIVKLEETMPAQRGWLLLRHDSEYGYFRSGTRGEIVVSVGAYHCFLVLKAKILDGSPTTSFSEIRHWAEKGILAI